MNISIRKERVQLNEIVISDDFKTTIPRAEKFIRYYYRYKAYNNMNNDIVIDENKVLIDGYISYLIYKMFDVNIIDAYINSAKN